MEAFPPVISPGSWGKAREDFPLLERPFHADYEAADRYGESLMGEAPSLL